MYYTAVPDEDTLTRDRARIKRITKTTLSIDTDLLARAKSLATKAVPRTSVNQLVCEGLLLRLKQMEETK